MRSDQNPFYETVVKAGLENAEIKKALKTYRTALDHAASHSDASSKIRSEINAMVQEQNRLVSTLVEDPANMEARKRLAELKTEIETLQDVESQTESVKSGKKNEVKKARKELVSAIKVFVGVQKTSEIKRLNEWMNERIDHYEVFMEAVGKLVDEVGLDPNIRNDITSQYRLTGPEIKKNRLSYLIRQVPQ